MFVVKKTEKTSIDIQVNLKRKLAVMSASVVCLAKCIVF